MDIQNKKILTFREGCQYLGLAESTVYKLTMNGKIPFSKPTNGRIFFFRERLENWVLGGHDSEEMELIKKQTP